MQDRVLLTEEVLLSMGFVKWGRDDMPSTLSYELPNFTLAPLRSHGSYDCDGYGFSWRKMEENKPSSLKAIFEFVYKDELETFLSFKKI